jgi:DNA-binding LacI/PurR family transcriptional regulator
LGALLCTTAQRGALHADLIAGIHFGAQARGIMPLLDYHDMDVERALECAEAMVSDPRLLGVIYWSATSKPEDPVLRLLERHGMPTVLVGDVEYDPGPFVSALMSRPDFEGWVKHYADLGYERFGIACGHRSGIPLEEDRPLMAAVRNARSLAAAVKKCGLPCPREIVLRCSNSLHEPELVNVEEALEACAGIQVVCCAQTYAFVLMLQLSRLTGLRIPADLELTSVVETALTRACRITAMELDYVRMGRRAVDILADLAAGRISGPVLETVPSRLVVRRSPSLRGVPSRSRPERGAVRIDPPGKE